MDLNVAAACGGRAESVPKRASFDLTNGLEFCIKKRPFGENALETAKTCASDRGERDCG